VTRPKNPMKPVDGPVRLVKDRGRRIKDGWDGFWFTPESTATIELYRIVFGLVMTWWVVTLAPVLMPFFGPRPALPEHQELTSGAWTVFAYIQGSTPAVWAFWLVALAGAVCVTIGYRTRVAAVIVFIAVMSVDRQAPSAFNAGDALLRVLAFYLMISQAGTAVSVDRWRRHPDRFWVFPKRAPWALRLLQIQFSVIYLSTVWDKIQGSLWRDGSAVSFALRVADVGRIPTPSFVTDSIVLMELATFGTLAAEIALGVLVWNRTARPWILAVGVALHVGIEFQLVVGFFSLGMLTLYLVWVSPSRAELVLRGAWNRAQRLRRLPSHQVPAPREKPAEPRPGARPPTKRRATVGARATARSDGDTRTRSTGKTRTRPADPAPETSAPETSPPGRVPGR
jgi:hypothetical protein